MRKIILIFFAILPAFLLAQEKKAWDFPVKPGTNEWKKFQSNQEMVDACQIPKDIISSISTEDLTEICLQYPLLSDVFAFENLNNGLDKLFADFNGFRELYSRKDAPQNLIKKYVHKKQLISTLDMNNTEIEKGKFIVSISLLEVLLCRCDIQNDAAINYKHVLQNLVSGYEEKIKYTDYFMGLGFRTNFYSRIHVISKIKKESLEELPQKSNNSVLFSGMADEQSIRVINELSNQLKN